MWKKSRIRPGSAPGERAEAPLSDLAASKTGPPVASPRRARSRGTGCRRRREAPRAPSDAEEDRGHRCHHREEEGQDQPQLPVHRVEPGVLRDAESGAATSTDGNPEKRPARLGFARGGSGWSRSPPFPDPPTHGRPPPADGSRGRGISGGAFAAGRPGGGAGAGPAGHPRHPAARGSARGPAAGASRTRRTAGHPDRGARHQPLPGRCPRPRHPEDRGDPDPVRARSAAPAAGGRCALHRADGAGGAHRAEQLRAPAERAPRRDGGPGRAGAPHRRRFRGAPPRHRGGHRG